MSTNIKTARLGGYTGLLPFLLSLLGFYLAPEGWANFFLQSFLAYSAVILSFIGAVHWGVLIHEQDAESGTKLLMLAVLPALVAWVSLLLPPTVALVILALAFPGVFIHEQFSRLAALLPGWYLRLRVQLTLFVTVMQFAAFAGLFR